jgi:hypothetical protein
MLVCIHPSQQVKNKQNSKDEDIIVEEETEKANNKESKKENSLKRKELMMNQRKETHVVQDIDQGNEGIEEEDDLER